MIRINQKVYRIIDIMVDIMVVSWFWRWMKSSNEVTQEIKKTVSNTTTPQHKKEPTKVWIIPQHQDRKHLVSMLKLGKEHEVYCAKYGSDNNGVVVLWCYS